ncbi:hemerythrin-like domain-containing protein [Rhizobium petrolearium]|uniref:hemerythrin domain-containing protein n=1 Tax=Neorhizobium petrolearium TaxID=515361 RepID=UPI001AE5DC16|nr:hemerythrin domain-containing protein [Neorhizobium petrolearium]MBP1844195.1 hemerythrin-like domain-containing protein [Neorhizobium petrolearium]
MPADANLNAHALAQLERNHEALMALCLVLEEIAFALPSDVDREACLRASQIMIPLLQQTHQVEERILFPDFDRNAGSHFAATLIERLKAEHRCDVLTCEEVSLMLKAMAERPDIPPEQAVRYMLQGFLESVRRHVLSEKLIIEALLVAEAEGREVLA